MEMETSDEEAEDGQITKLDQEEKDRKLETSSPSTFWRLGLRNTSKVLLVLCFRGLT
jgi:hypothetical protein